MKSFAAILAGVSLVAAQSLSQLPACGQTCVSNMISIAQSQFGCSVGNVTCYCTSKDFGYGVRDCSEQYCTSPQLAQSVIAFGLSYCASALATATSTGTTSTGTTKPSPSSTTVITSTTSVKTTAIPPAKSSALAAATHGIAAVAGSPGVYLVQKSHTISAGGSVYKTDGIVYSAAKSDVVVDAHGAIATVTPKLAASQTTVTSVVPTTGLAAAATAVSSVSKGIYVVDKSHTISTGGKGFTTAGTAYTAASDGVIIAAHGKSTTYVPTTAKTTTTTKALTPAAASSSSSSSTGAAPALQTAAPGLIGAVALAVLAL